MIYTIAPVLKGADQFSVFALAEICCGSRCGRNYTPGMVRIVEKSSADVRMKSCRFFNGDFIRRSTITPIKSSKY